MPVDLQVLEKAGGTAEKLKAKFEAKNPDKRIKEFTEHSANRIHQGIQQSQRDAHFWWAIDRAYDVSRRQVTYTLVEGLLDRKPSTDLVLQAAMSWGLEDMMVPMMQNGQPCCTPSGAQIKKLDLPTFFNIFVPVVAAYHKIRTAKLFNDRDLYPLYKYEPLKMTLKNKLKSEIVTDRIQRMSTEMGYRSDERQSIHQALLYGLCLNFPMEDWYAEKHRVMVDGKEKETVVKEGVRFAIPHPSRQFLDLAHRPSTLNSDTGCEWSGYWDTVRYSDIRNNKNYWNHDKISYGGEGSKWVNRDLWRIYQTMYPCVMSFPQCSGGSGSGAGQQDRMERAFYNVQNDMDSGVVIAPFFCKVVPKDWNLFDYEYPVWMRFIFASDDTVIWGRPLAYSPNVCYLYDADQSRAFQNSLGLELLPWQDHLGNYLTQYLLSVKKNLAKVVFWNSEVLEQKDIDQIRNLGDKIYTTTNFIPYAERELKWQQTNVGKAFHPVEFPLLNTQEIASAINVMISVMERMLGFSSQEVGSPATHEQTRGEVEIIALNTSVRLEFTGGHIDDGIKCKKKLLYDAMMAYSSDEIFAEVADLNDAKEKALEEMGFKIEDKESGADSKAGVRGSKKALKLEGFASEREGINRIPDVKIAVAMLQAFQTVFTNPVIMQEIGAKQLIELFNQILPFTGVPQGWRLKISPTANPEEQAKAAAQQMQALQQAITQQTTQIAQQVVQTELSAMSNVIMEQVGVPLKQGQDELQQQNQTLAEAVVKLAQQQSGSEQHDMMQDDAIRKLMQLFEIAAQTAPPMMPPVPYDQSGIALAPPAIAGPHTQMVAPAGMP